jgi:hypothetical protein
MVQVARDVYAMTGAGSNAGFVVTDEGVLAFDSDIRNDDQRDYFIMMRDEVAKMVLAGRSLEQIVKEFRVPHRFAHYAPGRLPGILRLFYNQLIERGL